jgi:hypothetical protein
VSRRVSQPERPPMSMRTIAVQIAIGVATLVIYEKFVRGRI